MLCTYKNLINKFCIFIFKFKCTFQKLKCSTWKKKKTSNVKHEKMHQIAKDKKYNNRTNVIHLKVQLLHHFFNYCHEKIQYLIYTNNEYRVAAVILFLLLLCYTKVLLSRFRTFAELQEELRSKFYAHILKIFFFSTSSKFYVHWRIYVKSVPRIRVQCTLYIYFLITFVSMNLALNLYMHNTYYSYVYVYKTCRFPY